MSDHFKDLLPSNALDLKIVRERNRKINERKAAAKKAKAASIPLLEGMSFLGRDLSGRKQEKRGFKEK